MCRARQDGALRHSNTFFQKAYTPRKIGVCPLNLRANMGILKKESDFLRAACKNCCQVHQRLCVCCSARHALPGADNCRAMPTAHDALHQHIAAALGAANGWLPFDDYMRLALYAPALGYYMRTSQKFGAWALQGGDFTTAPELSPLFARALARQVADALAASGADEVWEVGAGSGALAKVLIAALAALGCAPRRYCICELSPALRARQRQRLAAHSSVVAWHEALPDALHGVLLANEVLDAMPAKLLVRRSGTWHERGVRLAADGALMWEERPTALRLPVEPPGLHDYESELHLAAHAFAAQVARALVRGRGAAFFIDYGFPEAEYYHPQRHMGTLMCHRAQRADSLPLADAGSKDISVHVNFTGVALAAQAAGAAVLGYTAQARFLLNCGIAQLMERASLPERIAAMRLLAEHEMGELFKVLAIASPQLAAWQPCGFVAGDRTHRL